MNTLFALKLYSSGHMVLVGVEKELGLETESFAKATALCCQELTVSNSVWALLLVLVMYPELAWHKALSLVSRVLLELVLRQAMASNSLWAH